MVGAYFGMLVSLLVSFMVERTEGRGNPKKEKRFILSWKLAQ